MTPEQFIEQAQAARAEYPRPARQPTIGEVARAEYRRISQSVASVRGKEPTLMDIAATTTELRAIQRLLTAPQRFTSNATATDRGGHHLKPWDMHAVAWDLEGAHAIAGEPMPVRWKVDEKTGKRTRATYDLHEGHP